MIRRVFWSFFTFLSWVCVSVIIVVSDFLIAIGVGDSDDD